jgi:hypothetical protein
VIALEEYDKEHPTSVIEIFMFTDNFVMECAYFCGASTNLILFGLVLRLRVLEMRMGWKIHMINVAGMRIIVQ